MASNLSSAPAADGPEPGGAKGAARPTSPPRRATSFAAEALRAVEKAGLYRRLRHGKTGGQYITIDGRALINLCSNDYLGMGGRGRVEGAASGGGSRDDAGPGDTAQVQASSRLLSGGDAHHAMLEEALAESKSYEAALVYPTGYMANMGTIQVLGAAGDAKEGSAAGSVIFSDEFNHASIIDGCRLAGGSRTITYAHNDVADLERKISAHAGDGRGRVVIITEGVFSMDGDVAPLGPLRDVADRHGAVMMVDDAHGDFVLGETGGGTPEHLGISPRDGRGPHVYTSSLSKGLGSFGGYVASDSDVVDLCVNRSRAFIYTSALPSYFAEHAYRRMLAPDVMRGRRARLARNVKRLAGALAEAGHPTESRTHIMPVMIGDERRAADVSERLYRAGVYAPAIRYPTVPRGEARIRMSATAWLEDGDIDAVGEALESALA
ncbi:MAG: pyridoxal phosphate-dependent aminotransferase family protein [Thaumarchaeota archaeon]|nr:pyridoxal phosphate-dependent aminotransferase family protein [Nitrososphaerota archaeon]